MQFKYIDLEDKQIFEDYYKIHKQYSGFTSFVTLYTWRDYGKFRYAVYDGEIILRLLDNDETYLLLQTTEESIKKVIDYLLSVGKVTIKDVTKNQAEIIKKLYPDKFSFTHKRNDDNYYYLTESLISLSGKKLHSKRNFVNRFKKEYSYTYEKLTPESAKECVIIAKEWCERKNCNESGSAKKELSACETALYNMEKLGLKGGLIRVNSRIVAFSLGERLNDETVIVHFEKANTEFNGVFQIINNEFLINEWADTIYVNREEDMGVEGLRKAKLSYCPEFLLECYDAYENN